MKSEVVIPDDMRTRLPAPAAHLPKHKYVWMTNEEVASILINFLKHNDWITTSRVYRPESGCLLMFNRKKVKYRQDLYIWKTKRKSKWCREDHVKLKVGGTPCITALYVHSDILPTFHRRCYWFIQNPDIVLVHYLNYPYKDSGKQIIRDLSLNHQCQQWQHLSKQELIDQLHPMFTGIPWPSITSSPLDPESMDIIVDSLIENHYFEQRHRVLPLQNGLTQRIMKPRVIMANGNIEFTQNCSHVSLSSNSTTSNVKMNQSATPIFCNNASLILVNDATIRRASNSTELFLPGSVIPMIKPTHSDDSSMGNQLPGIKKNDIEGTKGRPNLRLMENHISIKPLCANVLSAQQLKVSEHDTTKSAQPLNEKLTNDMDIQTENKECNVNTPPILADYGVKDVMVPNCQSCVVQPKQSPFVESLKSSSVPDGGFDVFDVDSLFTTSTSKNSDQSASIDADQNNSSNESAVSDLFPQQLWEPVLDESSSMQSYSDMATNNLLETFGPITEYSPDWSYTEGGVKVLITGSWSFCGNFTCTFGNLLVPATNVQNGVLRCYAPAHKAGQVDLTVVCNGIIASRPVPFQYKEITPAHTELASEWLKLNEDQFKLSIISRLEKMEERLNSMGTSAGLNNQHGGAQYTLREATNHLGSGEEGRLVNLLKNLYSRYLMIGRSCAIDFGHEGTQGMSLLHSAAALGYLDLIHTLHSFGKSEVDWTPFVNGECSPGNVDKFGCSPLYWACARGHINCAEFLLGWDAAQLHIVDFLGRSPTGIASLHGHHQLFKSLEFPYPH
uniref:CG-1 domain-containing protein n=1 Tax=Ciona savignyi TaxID=51511 RepID=H2YF08_CIOSA